MTQCLSQPASNHAVETPARGHHLYVLCISLTVVILAPLMKILGDGRVAFEFLQNWPLPDLCLVHRYLHMSCPGCGLTRSIICLAHGHLDASLYYHRMGWAIALVILLQIPYRIVCLKSGSFPGVRERDAWRIGYVLLAGLIVNWVLGVIA